MSSYDPTTVEIFYEFLVEDYCLVAAGTFLIYDCLLTFDVEVEFFWKGSFTGAMVLFLANRYLAFANIIVNFFQLIQYHSDKSCALFQRGGLALVYLQFLPPAVFSGLRAYALSKNWPLAVLILVLSLIPYGINMADYGYHMSGFVDPLFGCLVTDTESLSISMKFTIIARSCLIASDILLIIITWVRLYRSQLFAPSGLSKPLTFERVLMQNGTLYFIVLLIMNVLHLSFSLESISGNGGYSAVTAFTPVVTSVLISRFLLDLQRAKHRPNNFQTSLTTVAFEQSTTLESMNFASRVMESLSETLAGDTEVGSLEVEEPRELDERERH